MSGPGKYTIFGRNAQGFWGRIHNFDTGTATLKPEHKTFLGSKIADVLRNGGSIRLIGLASRRGNPGFNDGLSLARAATVLQWLRENVRNNFQATSVNWRGEQAAAHAGVPDNDNHENWRSVVFSVWSRPTPPPPPPPPGDVIVQGIPVPPILGNGPLDDLGQVLDVGGFFLSIGELLAVGVVAAMLEALGALTGIISTLLSLPAGWLAADRLAQFNGRCQGMWNAFQDMANAFADPALDSRPVSQWPSIPRPAPHPRAGNASRMTESERQFQLGERQGCQETYEFIQGLESNPRDYKFTYQGQGRTIQVTGRAFLRILYRWRGRDVAGGIREEIDRRLRQQGRGEWPLFR